MNVCHTQNSASSAPLRGSPEKISLAETQRTLRADGKRIFFCRSGGGFPGIDIHAGIWLALEDAGIVATDCLGTSAGAVVGAFDADRYTASRCAQIVRALRDEDVREERRWWKVRAPWIDSFLGFGKITRVLSELLPWNFNVLQKPLTALATNDATGEGVELRTGELIPAIEASMAISGVFPRVEVIPFDDGHAEAGVVCSDGGTTANLPLPGCVGPEDEVWLLIARRPLAYAGGDNMLTRLLWNLDLLAEAQVRETVEQAVCVWGSKVKIIRPEVSVHNGALHFDHSLIQEAHAGAAKQIAAAQRDAATAQAERRMEMLETPVRGIRLERSSRAGTPGCTKTPASGCGTQVSGFKSQVSGKGVPNAV